MTSDIVGIGGGDRGADQMSVGEAGDELEREPGGEVSPPALNERVAIRASRIKARLLFVLLDTICVVAGYGVAEITYFRDQAPSNYWQRFIIFLLIAVVVTLLANHFFGLYERMWRHAGAQEARQLVLSSAVGTSVILIIAMVCALLHFTLAPVRVIVVGAVFATMGMGVLRFHSRLFAWQRGSVQTGLRVAIVGSRDMGAAAIREMQRCPSAGLIPVAVFDDDAANHGLSLLGVPVVGRIEDIPAASSRYTLQQVLLAIPSPAPELVERVLLASEEAGVSMKVLPGLRNLMSLPTHLAAVRQAREPSIEDLVGRTPVASELDTIRSSIAGRRVLVTGAGGSIGSEICRQISTLDPAILVLLDHDETHLHDACATLPGTCEQALVDITDRTAVFEVFKRYRPEIVLHAAAHKHVPVLEEYPVAAANTNVFGTLNVVEACAEVGATRFVLISTDKAVSPSSVMGASKRLAEQIVLDRRPPNMAFCAVRFGNVLGSRGSVIPTFARQIANGGPVTVTDARMTRFFMSVEEAVQLVLQSSMLSHGGEIFMLDMGQPVRILDLAKRMIRLSGYRVGVDIPIEIIGSRPGEKFDEELSMPDEEVLGTSHPHIHRLAPVAPHHDALNSSLGSLYEAAESRDVGAVRSLLFNSVTPKDEAAEALSDAKSSASTNGKPAREDPAMLERTFNTAPAPVGGGGGGG